MLEEILLVEEENRNFAALYLLGIVVVAAGFFASLFTFPSETGILSVVFASIPVMYSLTTYFFDEEREEMPGIGDFLVYASVFLGEATGFLLLAFRYPEHFMVQRAIVGLTGGAFASGDLFTILLNNILVLAAVFVLAAAIGSAGSFVLTWNASVLGAFLAALVRFNPVVIWRYMPHTILEISGFVIAGIVGTFASASMAREHFDGEVWRRYFLLLVLSVLLVIAGALIETA